MSNPSRFSGISRQFSDAERAIDDRVASHLTAPPLELNVGATMGETYKWLREDLALRSTLTKELGAEQEMAYGQSMRRELHDQAVTQEADDTETLSGIRQVHELVNTRKAADWNDAVHQTVSSNPRLAVNGGFNTAVADGSKYFQTDKQRQIRDLGEDVKLLGLGNEEVNLELQDQFMRDNPKYGAETLSRMQSSFDTAGITAANAATQANVQRLQGLQSLRKQEEMQQFYDENNFEQEDSDARIGLRGTFDELGLESVEDPARFLKRYRNTKSVMGMATDRVWRDQNLTTPEEKDAFKAAMSTVNREGAEPAEALKSRNLIESLSARWLRDRGDVIRIHEGDKTRAEIGKDMTTSYEDVKKQSFDLIKTKPKDMSDDLKADLLIAAQRQFVAQFASEDSGMDAVVTEYQGWLDKLAARAKAEKLKPQQVYEIGSQLSASFSAKAKQVKIARAVNPLAKSAPAAKTAGPYGESVLKNGVTYDWNGTKYIPRP